MVRSSVHGLCGLIAKRGAMPHQVVPGGIPVTSAAFAILTITIFPATQMFAQVSGSTLSGTVTDPSGAAINAMN
jgi:hypothetical protein